MDVVELVASDVKGIDGIGVCGLKFYCVRSLGRAMYDQPNGLSGISRL